MIKIPETPTRADAAAAADRLFGFVSTFPFLADADQSAACAGMMTGLSRRGMPAAPILAINATTPGSGKTKLANVVAIVATGRHATTYVIGSDPAETEKRIDSVLLDGDPIALLDNISFALKSDPLCVCATEQIKAVRPLGTSVKVNAPTNILFILTGNNLTILGDLTRRVMMVRLDAQCERPELRRFERDALDIIRERREEAIVAALTITRAYFAAGCPPARPDNEGRETLPPFGSFEDWDRLIRRPLVWAGMADPLETLSELREEDHEYVAMRALLHAWLFTYGEETVTASRIIQDSMKLGYQSSERAFPALADAVGAVLGDVKGTSARDLGYRLRAWQGRYIDGHRLIRDTKKTEKGIAYRLHKTT